MSSVCMFLRTSGKRPLTSEERTCGRSPYRHTQVSDDSYNGWMMRRTLPDGHVRNDALDGILPLVLVLTVQVSSELEVLACRHKSFIGEINPRELARQWTFLYKNRGH